MTGGVWAMAAMGALTSVVAPLLVLALRDRAGLGPLDQRATVALPVFAAVHALVVLVLDAGADWPRSVHLAGAVVVLAGAVMFWSPVLGRGHRLAADMGAVYLLLAAPALDLPAVVLVARGDAPGGLAMIAAMLPIGLAAVTRWWRAALAEESADAGITSPL